MKHPYEDILGVSYPFPMSRMRMLKSERGAQFSPFAALTGYDAVIRETARQTDQQIELDTDGQMMLDEKLKRIFQSQVEQPEITVTYFVPDEKKDGGSYVYATGKVKKLDNYREKLVFVDGREIALPYICDIDTNILQNYWMDMDEISSEG